MSSFQDVLPAPARKVQFTGLAAETLETGRLRLFLTAVMFALAFAAVANSGAHAESVLQKVMRFVEDAVPDRVSGAHVFTEHYDPENDY